MYYRLISGLSLNSIIRIKTNGQVFNIGFNGVIQDISTVTLGIVKHRENLGVQQKINLAN